MNRYVSYVLIGAAAACLLLLFIGLPPTVELSGAGSIASVPIANTSTAVLVIDKNLGPGHKPVCWDIPENTSTTGGQVVLCDKVDNPQLNPREVLDIKQYKSSCVVCYYGDCYAC